MNEFILLMYSKKKKAFLKSQDCLINLTFTDFLKLIK